MGDKQINLGLNFNVNKQNLDALQKSLDEIIAKARQTEKILPDYAGPFTEAAEAAKDFKEILTSSWNTQIGQLDLQKVEKGFISLYGSTKDFKSVLSQIGPESQKVFNQFSKAILQTQFPIKQTSAMLDKLAISFKNTVRYGISSSIWNNFSNSVRQAYTYVKDLDKSLNDIRIVSGQSADQMERLAIQANKTAQALGTSTLDYTKAALIYYQQGLSGEDVEERTQVTLKMANVLGNSAKEVSNYMTAIWNNFAKGSETLEHYADVITALGATTAASSEEIATGLSKFAAVANTVGLSYEYASAALATVVAQTRQSADTVGTAFKTLFARIQDLELGKTLDDGVTLGKYSLALQKVGITIKDSSNELKSMNTILSEMGEKWKTLDDAQKVALAQNVAGIRQYTQLIALMDNWDDFQTNLSTAGSAEGTLQSQQEIYLDSIEAHLEQLDAAWEGLYKNIFDEDALKFLADALTNLINLANTFVTGLGGGLNSIIYIAMTLGNIFSKQISENFIRMKKNADAAKVAMEYTRSAQALARDTTGLGSAGKLDIKTEDQILEEFDINQKILDIKTRMSQEEQEAFTIKEKELTKLEEEERILRKIEKHMLPDASNFDEEEWQNWDRKKRFKEQQKLKQQFEEEGINWKAADLQRRIPVNLEKINNNNDIIKTIGKTNKLGVFENSKAFENEEQVKQTIGKTLGFIKQEQQRTQSTIDNSKSTEIIRSQQEYLKTLKNEEKALRELKKHTHDYKDNVSDLAAAVNGLNRHSEALAANINDDKAAIEDLNDKTFNSTKALKENLDAQKALWNEKRQMVLDDAYKQDIQDFTSGIFTIGSSISSIVGMIKTGFNPDLSTWEKLSSIFSVLTTQSLILFSNWDKIKTVLPALYVITHKMVLDQQVKNGLITKELALEKLETIEDAKQAGWHLKDIATNIIKIAQQIVINGLKTIEALLTGKISSLTVAGVAAAAALIAGAALLTKWVINLVKANTEEAKLQKAVEDTKKAAEEANEAYKETKEIFDSYTEAKKNIDSLTEGTIEFYEAIQKSNEAAEQLIEKLGLIAGTDYGIDSNGLININEDRLNAKMFEEQQKTFRAQARKYEAQLNLEKYNEKQIVEQFRAETSIGTVGGRYGLSEEVAKNILANPASDASKVSELYGGNLERINSFGFISVVDAVEGSGKNIQSSLDNLSVDYQRNMAQQNNLNSLIASNLIMGYGSQADVAEYNKMTKRMQTQVQNNIIKAKESNKKENTAEDKNVWDYLWSGLKITGASIFGGALGGTAVATNEIASYVKNADQKKLVKESYMQNVLGYAQNKETGTWYDRKTGATIDYNKVIDSIDTEEARERYNSGEYITQTELGKQIEKIENYRKQVSSNGFNKTSENYIVEALMGNKDSIGLMTQEEFEYYLKNKYKNVDTTKLLQGAQENNQLLTSGALDFAPKSSILSDVSTWMENGAGNSLQRLLEDTKAYKDALADQAETLGTSAEALDVYAYAMDNAADKTHKQNLETAEAAAAQYKFNKAYNEGRVTYANNKELLEKYAKAIKDNKQISYDLADAVGEVSKSLKQMGLSLSAESLSKNLSLVNKLLNGTEAEAKKAYAELYKISQMDVLKSFFGDPKDLANGDEIVKKYQKIIDEINATEPGKNLAEKYSQQLADMINDTELTVTQIQQLADQLNIEIPVRMKEPEEFTLQDQEFTTKAQAVMHRYKGQMPNPAWDGKDPNKQKVDIDYVWTEYTEDKTDHFLVPKNTSFKVNKNSQNITKGQNFSIAPSNNKSKSSGSSSKNTKDKSNDEFDRYHQINTQITKISNSLKKLESQQKKLVGGKLIENLNKQWQLLNTQVENYNKKLDIANDEQKELYDKLAKRGFKFNDDGTVANYMSALKAAEDKYNKKVEQYNKLSAKNQKKWDQNKTLDKAKEEYEETKKIADRYDELISNFIPGLQQDIQDSLDKQIELNVQKFNLKLTVTLDMNQATRDWNEWKKRIIDGIDEDDIYGNANARLQDFSTYYSENGRGDIQAQTEQVKSILTELKEMDENGWSDIYHDDRAQALEELKEKYTALMESMTDAAQIEKDLYQAVLDEMDAVREKFDEQVESYEFLRDIINHDLKVIQMVYGEDAYGAMSKFYDKQQQTYNEQLDFHKQEMDLWYARMQAAEEGSKEWEKARDNWKDAVKNYNETLEEGLENAKNKFQNALNDIFQNLNNQVTNGKGLDFVNEEWELVNKNANKYLDTINATYGIRELEKKYLDSINKTDNVKAQQKLKKVMDEQLTNLRQKDKLTQYDLDRANKLYEIELARMALEDARQNKSQMRLRRDSQGNYSYQYVANQDELQKAQDQVDQLTNSLYNFDKERYNAVLSEVYTIWSEYQQKMADASLINDPELRAEKQRLIQEQYNQLMMQTEEDYQVSKYNLEESFFKDWTNLNDMSLEDFQNLSDNEKDIIMTEMVPTWKNGISEMAEVFYGENGFARVTQDSWKAIKDAEKEYDDDLKTLETTAGQTYDAIKNGLNENIPKSEELIKNNNDLITVYDEELTRVENVYRAVGDLITQYREAEQAAKDAAEAAYKYENKEYNNQIDEIGDQGNSEPEPEKQPEPTPPPQPEPTPTPVDNTPKTGTGNGIPEVGDDVTVKKSATKFSSKSGGAKMWNKVPGNKFYIKAVSGNEIKIGDPHGPNYTDTGITGWVNKKDLEGYDTGGYTGAWDNSGRLAMLHQKELILNQTDTKNMLNAVSVMRGLTYSLGSSILAKLANASATNYSNTGEGGGILEQDVHIEATFPNVRNAVEIEQALNNLVNVASQRIMEKR